MKTLLILAGGFGTRLRTVVSDVPKPLAPVCGQPFLKYLVKNSISQGVREIVFLLFFEATKIEKMLEQMAEESVLTGVSIKTIVEEKPLGTGGSVLNAIDSLEIEESFILMNADTWLGSGLKSIDKSISPSLAVVNVNDTSRYGQVITSSGLVKQFHEKASTRKKGLINAGLYHLSYKDFQGFKVGETFSLESEVLPKLVKSDNLRAVEVDCSFIDIGIPEDYFKFCKWIESGEENEL